MEGAGLEGDDLEGLKPFWDSGILLHPVLVSLALEWSREGSSLLPSAG